MPFTLAHPAAVLPFHSKWRNGFLGLVIGSLGPDIQYFLPARLGDSLGNSHTFSGAITVATPMALCVLVLLVAGRRIVVAPLWGAFREAIARALLHVRRSRASWVQVIPATIVGSEIHILWDSFTHKTGWMALHIPVLTHDVSPLAGHPLALCRALQYASSIAGIVVIVIWCRRRMRAVTAADTQPGWRPWALVALSTASILAAWHAAHPVAPPLSHPHGWEYIVATTAVRTFIVLYAALGAVIEVARAAGQS